MCTYEIALPYCFGFVLQEDRLPLSTVSEGCDIYLHLHAPSTVLHVCMYMFRFACIFRFNILCFMDIGSLRNHFVV